MSDAADRDPDAHQVHRVEVDDGLSLAYVREGTGGYPLLLVHGYPETKRIWWRNIEPLADAGFEVIAPDLRGHGDSDLAPDGFYDIAAFSDDLRSLMRELGHDRYGMVGGDVGALVLYDHGLRFPGAVERQCFFNTLPPPLGERYEQAGIPPDEPHHVRQSADYFRRQSRDADALLAELDTPARRRAYVADMYGHRLWAAPGTFDPDDVDFMTEPYADAARLRASWGVYEGATGNRPLWDAPRVFETNPVPTLVLYGPEDHVVPASFPQRCAVAFTECIGPFVVPGAGHFLQWEAAGILNRALVYLFRDLLETHHA
ncbi:MAG: alpha/beta hydrolase [Acidimicrobiia bacterium]|nr:alpha/beta hydrolase [Acidimicrobiia bacterium]